ncbi:MAG: hypothetical protein ACTSWN_09570 [Promethearchaeota archaeon]
MSLTIQLNKAFYYPNETIIGKAIISLNNMAKAQALEVSFTGIENSYIIRRRGKYTQTYHSTRVIVSEHKWLWNAEANGPLQMAPATIPFQFTIPLQALPSIEHDTPYLRNKMAINKGMKQKLARFPLGHVIYVIKAVLHLKRAVDKKTKVVIKVLPPPYIIQPNPPLIQTIQPVLDNPGIQLTIPRNLWAPGEIIKGYVSIFNPARKKIRKCIVKLDCFYSHSAKGYVDQFTYTADKYVIVLPETSLENPIPFEIYMPPMGPFTTNGTIVQIQWFVVAALDLPLKKNIKVSCPIYIVPIQNLPPPI